MSSRFGHYGHVWRVAGLFAGGFAIFLLLRAILIPPDFGVYGFYRAGALDDVRAQPAAYVGQATCVGCHADIDEARQEARHAKIACEACHGPASRHIEDFSVTPAIADARPLCLRCHAAGTGKPDFVPTVVADDHAGDLSCVECHNPHRPRY